MAQKVSRDRGYRSDSIAVSRDMGPLRPAEFYLNNIYFRAVVSKKLP